ncbi:hypothetical protein BJ742DRAFT_831559 [Cladochytrium replicatum]|nr:hypothetical protein BJ742DRAFT_831559 [Cladochytrium replicatum]
MLFLPTFSPNPTRSLQISSLPARAPLYKALPMSTASLPTPPLLQTNWSALYPQLSLSRALSYLPNQFDREFSTPCIALLTPRVTIPLIVYTDALFLDPECSADVKAARMRECVEEAVGLQREDGVGLMEAVGRKGYVVAMLDAEAGGYEVAVPHCLANEEIFEAHVLFEFEESEVWKGTVGRVKGLDLRKEELWDLDLLGQRLESEFKREETLKGVPFTK